MPAKVTLAAILVAGVSVIAGISGAQRVDVCAPDGEVSRDVRAVARGIVAADNARDLEKVLSYYAPDALLMPPGERPVAGRAAIRPRYEDLFSRFDPRIDTEVEEACVAGDLAVVRGRNTGRLLSRDGAGARDLDDVYLMVLRRGGDGRWQISQLMWH